MKGDNQEKMLQNRKDSTLKPKPDNGEGSIDRRCFLKLGAVLGGGLIAGGPLAGCINELEKICAGHC
jgi:hypothetical protein